MAAAIYNKLTNTHDADSVGTYAGAPEEPEGQILSNLMSYGYFFPVLESHGIDIKDNRTKKLLPSMLDRYDLVVSMA